GELRDELWAKGLDRNTYFVFSSDNGFHLGEHRLSSGKQTAFETDIRVPVIVSGPDVPAGRDASQLTSSIDLAPTFETLAGLPVPAGVDGHSLAGLWHGQDPAGWPLAVLIEHHGPDFSPDDPDRQTSKPGDPPTYEAVRTATALYVRYAGGAQEYYDTAAVPYELDDMPGRGRELLDVVGHERAVGQVDPGEQEVLLVVVPVCGQMGERGAVQGLQRGAHRGLLREQRAAAWIGPGDLGDLPGRVLQIRPGQQQRRPVRPRVRRGLP